MKNNYLRNFIIFTIMLILIIILSKITSVRF